ncbi:MAG: manganese efflux pump MntP family protein [Eubacteriales bacterium]|nr:manganese efflux pump MntP family protein [Eubacteriales bacterium]
MSFLELFLLAVALSMDAFAVSVCKGLAMGKPTFRKSAVIGLWFGLFQAGMPLIGYMLGSQFYKDIVSIDHWVAFVLLALIGGKMIFEAFSKADCDTDSGSLKAKVMFILAIATSIDALAVGITFAFLQVNIFAAVLFIGAVTFIISVIGVKTGSIFGFKYKSKAELTGGIILILLGIKTVLEHMELI